MAASGDGVITILVGIVFGGFCGMLGGFIVAQISRYVSYLTGRHLWGARWVLIGSVVGAVIFGIKGWLAKESQ